MNTISFLNILQLEEYKLDRFLKWAIRNPFGKELENKKPLVWTEKMKFIAIASFFWFLLIGTLCIAFFNIFGLLLTILFTFIPWIFIALSVISRKPYEIVNKEITITKTRKKIEGLKENGLKVIGITGSYGKTTTKEFLYQILCEQFRVLRTPESYNTLFGISKVIDLELDKSYDFFICEMGAYKIGEIKEICRMVLPDFGILTGINEQHLERFRKIENTIKAKFELIEAVNNDAKCLLNHDSKLVVDNYLKYIKKPNFYKAGDINFLNEELLGVANISNATASAKMAKIVGASSAIIKNKLSKLKPFSHRLEVKKLDNGWILLDDSYNSNVAGFKSALEALSNYKGTKIIATPGIVELGHLSNSIHLELGNYCDKICDFIILVGKSSRTEFLSRGVENKYKIIRIDSINSLNKTVENLGVKFPIILIENDLTDNY